MRGLHIFSYYKTHKQHKKKLSYVTNKDIAYRSLRSEIYLWAPFQFPIIFLSLLAYDEVFAESVVGEGMGMGVGVGEGEGEDEGNEPQQQQINEYFYESQWRQPTNTSASSSHWDWDPLTHEMTDYKLLQFEYLYGNIPRAMNQIKCWITQKNRWIAIERRRRRRRLRRRRRRMGEDGDGSGGVGLDGVDSGNGDGIRRVSGSFSATVCPNYDCVEDEKALFEEVHKTNAAGSGKPYSDKYARTVEELFKPCVLTLKDIVLRVRPNILLGEWVDWYGD